MLSCCLYVTYQTFKSHYAKVILFVIKLFCSMKQKNSLNALPVVQCACVRAFVSARCG